MIQFCKQLFCSARGERNNNNNDRGAVKWSRRTSSVVPLNDELSDPSGASAKSARPILEGGLSGWSVVGGGESGLRHSEFAHKEKCTNKPCST